MQILFGKLDNDMAESFLNDGGSTFEQDGDHYEYSLTMDTENIRIEDSIGRYVPFSPEDIKSLFKAVRVAKAYAKGIVEYNEIQDELEEGYIWCV